ncbi:M20/M25/M40 family metallo-hydrolase [Candidatus Sumerlaeota bacterium]|nr:M20/M25/M40 family metallo-hydrolase [Candidatus Sumerlaeota bacterium]
MSKRWRVGCWSIVVVAFVCVAFAGGRAAAAQQSGSVPNWAEARDEAMRLLGDLIKIDTTNPPGNETKAAQYLKTVLDREGIASQIFELEPGRGNIVARLKGSGKKRPILLMGHTDVVAVERDKWSVDPFAAVVKDGYMYGRGASDNKNKVAAYLEVLLLLHRLKVPLDRDVIYMAQAGEESSTRVGMDFMVEKHWDEIACEFALDEGGVAHQRDGRVVYVGIATMEKVPRPGRLVAKGSPGHGSRPRPDNAIVHLAAAVAKVGTFQMPMRLNETTRRFFQGLSKVSPPDEAYLFTHLEDPKASATVQETIRVKHLGYNSMLRTTISPTIISGGYRGNVIPSEAEANLDIRILPDENLDALEATLRSVIADPVVEVSVSRRGRPVTPPSRLDSEMFRALERSASAAFPGVPTLPQVLSGATDMAQLRARGVQAYGLGSVMTEDDASRIHGNDERVSVEGMGKFLQFVYGAVVEVAAAR